jgi:hemoglobin-like flavoprotein
LSGGYAVAVDGRTLALFEESLRRCFAKPGFLDRFYELFLGSSPEIKEKFANTDLERQKSALRASFQLLVSAASDEHGGPEHHLNGLAERHSRRDLDIGAAYYDLWLDSLLQAAREFDGEFTADVEKAWENVLGVGVKYLLSKY